MAIVSPSRVYGELARHHFETLPTASTKSSLSLPHARKTGVTHPEGITAWTSGNGLRVDNIPSSTPNHRTPSQHPKGVWFSGAHLTIGTHPSSTPQHHTPIIPTHAAYSDGSPYTGSFWINRSNIASSPPTNSLMEATKSNLLVQDSNETVDPKLLFHKAVPGNHEEDTVLESPRVTRQVQDTNNNNEESKVATMNSKFSSMARLTAKNGSKTTSSQNAKVEEQQNHAAVACDPNTTPEKPETTKKTVSQSNKPAPSTRSALASGSKASQTTTAKQSSKAKQPELVDEAEDPVPTARLRKGVAIRSSNRARASATASGNGNTSYHEAGNSNRGLSKRATADDLSQFDIPADPDSEHGSGSEYEGQKIMAKGGGAKGKKAVAKSSVKPTRKQPSRASRPKKPKPTVAVTEDVDEHAASQKSGPSTTEERRSNAAPTKVQDEDDAAELENAVMDDPDDEQPPEEPVDHSRNQRHSRKADEDKENVPPQKKTGDRAKTGAVGSQASKNIVDGESQDNPLMVSDGDGGGNSSPACGPPVKTHVTIPSISLKAQETPSNHPSNPSDAAGLNKGNVQTESPPRKPVLVGFSEGGPLNQGSRSVNRSFVGGNPNTSVGNHKDGVKRDASLPAPAKLQARESRKLSIGQQDFASRGLSYTADNTEDALAGFTTGNLKKSTLKPVAKSKPVKDPVEQDKATNSVFEKTDKNVRRVDFEEASVEDDIRFERPEIPGASVHSNEDRTSAMDIDIDGTDDMGVAVEPTAATVSEPEQQTDQEPQPQSEPMPAQASILEPLPVCGPGLDSGSTKYTLGKDIAGPGLNNAEMDGRDVQQRRNKRKPEESEAEVAAPPKRSRHVGPQPLKNELQHDPLIEDAELHASDAMDREDQERPQIQPRQRCPLGHRESAEAQTVDIARSPVPSHMSLKGNATVLEVHSQRIKHPEASHYVEKDESAVDFELPPSHRPVPPISTNRKMLPDSPAKGSQINVGISKVNPDRLLVRDNSNVTPTDPFCVASEQREDVVTLKSIQQLMDQTVHKIFGGFQDRLATIEAQQKERVKPPPVTVTFQEPGPHTRKEALLQDQDDGQSENGESLQGRSSEVSSDPDKTLVGPEDHGMSENGETEDSSSTSGDSETSSSTSGNEDDSETCIEDEPEDMSFWRLSLKPYQVDYFDELVNVSHRLIQHEVDEERADENMILDFYRGTLNLIQRDEKDRIEAFRNDRERVESEKKRLREYLQEEGLRKSRQPQTFSDMLGVLWERSIGEEGEDGLMDEEAELLQYLEV